MRTRSLYPGCRLRTLPARTNAHSASSEANSQKVLGASAPSPWTCTTNCRAHVHITCREMNKSRSSLIRSRLARLPGRSRAPKFMRPPTPPAPKVHRGSRLSSRRRSSVKISRAKPSMASARRSRTRATRPALCAWSPKPSPSGADLSSAGAKTNASAAMPSLASSATVTEERPISAATTTHCRDSSLRVYRRRVFVFSSAINSKLSATLCCRASLVSQPIAPSNPNVSMCCDRDCTATTTPARRAM
mmetsp:Transcript_77029/g.214220  ORF Transcript_77029/g.214220 Transcript_77029/m.214220 type:complete len:247 (-) Transcript_77029:35-775(-)